jgi:mono/diheme cytochrome c family protein
MYAVVAVTSAPMLVSCHGTTGGASSRTKSAPAEAGFLGTPVDPRPPVTPQLIAHGRDLFLQNCVACHGPHGDGKGYGAPFLSPPPRDFTPGVYRLRSTPTGSVPTDDDLYRTVSRGVSGTAMPAWKWFLPDPTDRWALVEYVKTLSNRWPGDKPETPVAIGQPPADVASPGSIARGKALYAKMQCFNCHGEDGLGDGPAALTLKDDAGHPIGARDFSNPGKFKGGWNEREIARTFLTGLDGTPMPSYRGAVPDQDIWSLAAYVKSLGRPAPMTDVASHGISSAAPDPGPPDVHVALLERGWHYQPNIIRVKKGQVVEVTLTVTDNGLGAGHGFAIDGLDERSFINGAMLGAPKSIKFRADQAGTFGFHCVTQCSTSHLHPNMTGTLIVEE